MIPFLVLWAQDIYGFASCAAHLNGVGLIHTFVGDHIIVVCAQALVGEFQPEGQDEAGFCWVVLFVHAIINVRQSLLEPTNGLILVLSVPVDPGLVYRQVDVAQTAVGDGESALHAAGVLSFISRIGVVFCVFVGHLIPVVVRGNVEDGIRIPTGSLVSRIQSFKIIFFVAVLVLQVVLYLILPHPGLHHIEVVNVVNAILCFLIVYQFILRNILHFIPHARGVVAAQGYGVISSVFLQRLVGLGVVYGEGHRLPMEVVAVVQPHLLNEDRDGLAAAAVGHYCGVTAVWPTGRLIRGEALFLQQGVAVRVAALVKPGQAGDLDLPGNQLTIFSFLLNFDIFTNFLWYVIR